MKKEQEKFLTIKDIVELKLLDCLFGVTTYDKVKRLFKSGRLKFIEVGGGEKRVYRATKQEWIDEFLQGNNK